jgi:glycosyltransferase involved in cell wall biosynthesis
MNAVNSITRILFLWSPLADYTVACLRKLAEKKDVELYMIYQPGEIDAPYNQLDLRFFKKAMVYQKEQEKELFDFCMELNPDLIMMASWNYPFYMSVARKSKSKGIKVISTFDNQWRSTPKQWLGVLSSPFFLKPAIHNFFVPGDRQVHFAQKLGYENPLQGYYCAFTERFKEVKPVASSNKFIFVGRLVPEKGVDYLVEAYKEYRNTTKDPWDLIIVGKGRLRSLFENVEGIILKEFVQPNDLPAVLSQATCLILPSVFEPWALVIHEAAISGLSIICTHACGASTQFVRDGQNGYIIHADKGSLISAMKKMSAKSQKAIEEMSATSRLLGSLWTTDKWADYVYENICEPQKQRGI